MTETAIVLFVEHSKQVLATVTRTGDAAAAPSAEELAGDRFPFRDETGGLLVEIAAEELATNAVPFSDDLVTTPQECGTVGDKNSTAELLTEPAPTVVVTSAGVQVTVGNNVAADTPVWAQVDSDGANGRDHDLLPHKVIPAGSKTVQLPLGLTAGKPYDVLVLVQGSKPYIETDAIPA
jgi:hypothetical protein